MNELEVALNNKLDDLSKKIEGDLVYDKVQKVIYATDASAYREIPQAVCLPRSINDIIELVQFARENKLSLIPRAAGTSLAGQVVGNGIIVDVSKYMTQILELNVEEQWVRVQPGVIRDELNMYLAPHGLYFGPETSTSNRAMMGGMVGNNSCGSNSVVYGSTREHLLEVNMILADGSEVVFKETGLNDFQSKCEGSDVASDLEKQIYENINSILSNTGNQEEIKREFPKPEIPRRNTGYAIDLLMQSDPFTGNGIPFNFCKLIAGSEGTLGMMTEIKLHLIPTPPPEKAVVCVHFDSLYESLEANLIGLKYKPSASELIDHYILDCTKQSIQHKKTRFFLKGDPKAILVVEFSHDDEISLQQTIDDFIKDLKDHKYGYHYPVLRGSDVQKVWALRKAGLGLLSNIPGDAKPVPVIEDTAVEVKELPAYIKEFNELMKEHDLYCVHYAHAGSGEIHLRPIIDLKTSEGHQLFRTVLKEIAVLVKKYKGSLSGEHGDGRLRGEFISFMIGDKNYELLKEIKRAWDPNNIFNPGKIVDTPPMNSSLRYEANQEIPDINTYFDFSSLKGVLRAAEMCNGSGDCRKTHLTGGVMCPSYMATKNEKDTTRARANMLREILTNSEEDNRFDSEELYQVMELCLSCKGCKSECPSNVDMARLKGEFLQNYYDVNGVPLRSRMVGQFSKVNKLASKTPALFNVLSGSIIGKSVQSIVGFSPKRKLPAVSQITLDAWYNKFYRSSGSKPVWLFSDEFTNYNDAEIGIKAIKLLDKLGYHVQLAEIGDSGRALFSKGLIKKARPLAEINVKAMVEKISEEHPLIGIEPSAILSFRDEYPDLVGNELKDKAVEIGKYCYLFDEFISKEFELGNIQAESFVDQKQEIKVHGHCHQKTLGETNTLLSALSIPVNYSATLIDAGCCGMAGSFGYEKEHYGISMEIGELKLFPEIRESDKETIISAPGTSCRHQINDGTGRHALHPAEVLWDALLDKD
ncbi:FAD-binding and (Fe-S)-binding domain-containing protein [Bacteroidota bacterium]